MEWKDGWPRDALGHALDKHDIVVVANRKSSYQWLDYRVIVDVDSDGKHITMQKLDKCMTRVGRVFRYLGHSDMVAKVR